MSRSECYLLCRLEVAEEELKPAYNKIILDDECSDLAPGGAIKFVLQ